jgi:hypothetical protein
VSRTALILGALMLLGLALRLWFIQVNVIDPRYSAADDGDYYQRALRFAATGVYSDNSWLIRPPLHVFMFASLIRFAMWLGDPTLGIPLIRAVHVALSLLTIPLGYDMARRLFNPLAGLIFAALLAVWFPLVELPALILSEPLFFFLLFYQLWALVRWRDSRRWPWLALAGLFLGLAALARSPALYTSTFVVGFLLLTSFDDWRMQQAGWRFSVQNLFRSLRSDWPRRFLLRSLTFLIPFVLVIAPWTTRNYLTYGEFIVVDTLGPVNLWLALSDGVNEGRGENEGKSILAAIPQAERQDFVSAEIARIVREEPWRLVRNFWPHFTHIWKAQFVEDYFVKVSFFTRPLREIWPMGAASDVLWFGFALASTFAFAAPLREGHFRWIALGWMAYSALTVMLIHVEPRYLLPIWFFMMLYGSAALSWLFGGGFRIQDSGFRSFAGLQRKATSEVATANASSSAAATLPPISARRRRWHMVGGAILVLIFLTLVFSYRNYPQIVAQGVQRESHRAQGVAAYERGDYQAAIAAFELMLADQPFFVDGRTDLARVYLEMGDYEGGWEALGNRQTHRSDVIRGALAREQGDLERARFYFEDAEFRAGEDVQALTLQWLNPDATNTLTLGDGLDFGYLQGFSFGEDLSEADGSVRSYRWLQGDGKIVLPLARPLQEGSFVRLRMTGTLPDTTPLRVTIGDHTTTLHVRSGEWRVYRVPVPATMAGQQRITIALHAPTFVPVQFNPASSDARLLSLMISNVAVE